MEAGDGLNHWWQAITVALPMLLFMGVMWWRTLRVHRLDKRLLEAEARIAELMEFKRQMDEIRSTNPYLFTPKNGLRLHG